MLCKLIIYGRNVLNCGWNRHVSSCHSLYLRHACAEYKENQVNIRDPSSFYTAPSPPHKLRNQAIHSSPRIQLSRLFFFWAVCLVTRLDGVPTCPSFLRPKQCLTSIGHFFYCRYKYPSPLAIISPIPITASRNDNCY